MLTWAGDGRHCGASRGSSRRSKATTLHRPRHARQRSPSPPSLPSPTLAHACHTGPYCVVLSPARGAAACTRVCELTASASASQVNLPSGVANVSFVGLAGSSFTGDMAIDSVVLAGRAPACCPCSCAWTCCALQRLQRPAVSNFHLKSSTHLRTHACTISPTHDSTTASTAARTHGNTTARAHGPCGLCAATCS